MVIFGVNLHGPVPPLALRWHFGGESLAHEANEQGWNTER
jgi:hypothetical protein